MHAHALTLLLAFAVPDSAVAASRTLVHHRGLFDLIRPHRALAQVCAGRPFTVETHRTPRDIAAAIFTGFLYTPAHVTVTCR